MHSCTFSALPCITRKTTYAELRAAVIKAGRFSCFEASANLHASSLFSQLGGDKTVICDHEKYGYPWIAVTAIEESPWLVEQP